MKFLSKRLLTTLAFTVLCASATPTKADDNHIHNTLLIGSAIIAGIVGACSLIYGIVQSCKKSPEQIAQDAQEALDTAHMYGELFRVEYETTFDQAYLGSNLASVESNFLEAIMRRTQGPNARINIEDYIDNVRNALTSLEQALQEVKACVENLKSRNKTDLPIYDSLVNIMLAGEAELAYLKTYHYRFAEHRAYFALAACEAKLRKQYKDALLLIHVDSNESPLLYIAKMHTAHSAYPLVQYYQQLCNYIATLDHCIRSLTHQYSKIRAAKKLWHQLSIIRDIIADAPAFKEEYTRKKEDDAQRVLLELKRHAVETQAQMIRAATQQACAAQQCVCIQQTPSTPQFTATGQNGNNNADDAQITIGSGNNQRTVSVEWYEQNKPGAAGSYID